MNMLGKLKIRCEFKGCKEIVLLEEIIKHKTKCRYNVEMETKKCKKCFSDFTSKSSHDCIKALLELNKKANEEIETLKRSSRVMSGTSSSMTSAQSLAQNTREQSLMREIRELKTENENFLKTFQEMSNLEHNKSSKSGNLSFFQPKTHQTNSSIISSSEISEQEIFNLARKHLWNPDIPQNDLNKEMTNKLLTIVRAQIKEYNSIFVVSKNIVEKMNAEFGNRWHCMASFRKPIISYYCYEPGHLIKLKFGELQFEIYKTQFLNVNQMKNRFRNGKIKRVINILRTDMKQSMISDVKKIVFSAIERSESLTNISSELKTQMEKRYPGKWQTFIFAYFGVFGIEHLSGTFISFDLDNLTITLFQAIK